MKIVIIGGGASEVFHEMIKQFGLTLKPYDHIPRFEPKEAYSRKSKGPRDRYGRVK